MKKLRGFKHRSGGNCWEGIASPQDEDVCLRHDEPRGDCSICPRCPACDNLNLATSLSAEITEATPETYVLQPSASKVDLLFACTYPFGKTLKREVVGERTRFGSAFHETMEARLKKVPFNEAHCAKTWGVDEQELEARIEEALPVVKAWLSGGNMWGLDFTKAGIETEVSVAIDPRTGEARFLPDGPGEHHDYPGRLPGEVPGTADVFSITPDLGKPGHPRNQSPRRADAPKTLLVLDHKSGWNVAQGWQPQTPAESGQLRTLALALAKLYQVDQVIVAFFHAPLEGQPTVYADMLTEDDLKAHQKSLKSAMGNVGSDWLRPGPWCPLCPAFSICPTQTTTLVELKRGSGALTAERVGAIHQAAALYDNLRERLREEMRAWVAKNGPGIRPDGALVDLVDKEVTRLSQASVIRALGPLKGAKEIQRLKKIGAIETKTQKELRAVRR
jgi:hypothetical protein